MAGIPVIVARVELRNPKDVNGLLQAVRLATEIVEDQPWNDNAKQVVELVTKALKGLMIRSTT